MPGISTATATAPYDLTQAEEDIATLQGQLADLEESHYSLFTGPQPPNSLSDRVQLYGNSAQQLFGWQDPNNLNAVVPGTIVVWQPGNTVNGTSLANLASQQIPANNGQVNSLYEMEVWGNIVTGTTTATLELAVNLGGSAQSQCTLGTSFWGTNSGQAWRFHVTCRVMVSVTGVSGVWNSMIAGEVCTFSNIIGGSGSQNAVGITSSESTGTITLSTAQQNQFGLLAAWSNTTSAPTITSRWAMFSKRF